MPKNPPKTPENSFAGILDDSTGQGPSPQDVRATRAAKELEDYKMRMQKEISAQMRKDSEDEARRVTDIIQKRLDYLKAQEEAEERLFKKWDKEYKRQDEAKKRAAQKESDRQDREAKKKLERDLRATSRVSDKQKADAKKLVEQQARDAKKLAEKQARDTQRAADKAQRQAAAAATKAQNAAARAASQAQKQQARAATQAQNQQAKAAAQAIKQQNQTLLQGLANRNNAQQLAARGAMAQQRALGSIANNIQTSLVQRARQMAATGGPAGRARASHLLNTVGPTMVQQAQAAYLAKQNSGANAATMGAGGGGGPRNGLGAAAAGAGGGGNIPRPPMPPPPPRPSLLSRGVSYADRKVDSLRQSRDDYREVNSGDMLDKLSMALKGNGKLVAAGAAASAATAALGAAAGSAGGAIGLLKTVFMSTWNYIDTKVLPTTSLLNRALGATTPNMANLRKETMGTALQFERLGLGFEHGAQTVKELSVGLKTANIPKDTLDALVKVSEYVGVGGEQAGRMGRSFLSTGTMTKDLGKTVDKVMMEGANAANEFAVPVNLIRKEFAENIDLMQRWGTENTMQFNRAIAKAASYGLSIKELEGTFGRSLDTFESTSDIASKLNAAFGTSLDSVKLLTQNSSERIDTVRNAVLNSGFQWNKASKFAKNVLMETLKLKDEEEAAGIFGSQKQRDAAIAKIKQQKQIAAGMDEWRKALSSLATQLTSIEQLTRNFFMAIGNVVAKLLGFDSGIDATKKGVKTFETFMDRLTGKINDFANKLPKSENGAGSAVIAWVDNLSSKIDGLSLSARGIVNAFEDLTMLNEGNASSISEEFLALKARGSAATPAEWDALRAKFQETPFLNSKQSAMAYKKAGRFTAGGEAAVRSQLMAPETARRDLAAQQMQTMRYGESPPPYKFSIYLDSKEITSKVAANLAAKGVGSN